MIMSLFATADTLLLRDEEGVFLTVALTRGNGARDSVRDGRDFR